MNVAAGYREHEHTADWELEAWAPDFAALLEQAARGMYALAGVRLGATSARREIHIRGDDREMLLVRFLQELLYLDEMEGLGFDHFDIRPEAGGLGVSMAGAPVRSRAKQIKAVTYHKLKIETTPGGLRVRIVFDV